MVSPPTVFAILLVHLVVTAMLVGVIWEVQLVAYPHFADVGSLEFPAYHASHCRRITWIVGPLMLIELVSAGVLVPLLWNSPLRLAALAGILLVGATWASTAFLQVPLHERLSLGWDRDAITSLVRGNWIRVATWSLRLGLAVLLLVGWIGTSRLAASE